MNRPPRSPGALFFAAMCLALAACANTGPSLGPAQLEALQSREFDAPAPQTLAAVAGVLLDEGLIYTLSDHEAGLVGAIGGPWMDVQLSPETVVVWVRPAGPDRSVARARLPAPAHPSSQREYNRFWVLVERRLLAGGAPGDPAPLATP